MGRYALRPSCLGFRLPSGLTPLLPLCVVDRPIPIIHYRPPPVKITDPSPQWRTI